MKENRIVQKNSLKSLEAFFSHTSQKQGFRKIKLKTINVLHVFYSNTHMNINGHTTIPRHQVWQNWYNTEMH